MQIWKRLIRIRWKQKKNKMTIEELIKQCDEVIASDAGQSISLLLPGTWGVKDTRRFGAGGPIGEIKEYLLQLCAIENQVKRKE